MGKFLFVLGGVFALFLIWFISVYFLQKLFNFSDQTATLLINIGGVIASVLGFLCGLKYGNQI